MVDLLICVMIANNNNNNGDNKYVQYSNGDELN